MITETLLDMFFSMLQGVINAMPTMDSSWMYSVNNAIGVVLEYLNKANEFIPVTPILIVIGIIVGIYVFKFTWWIVNWIIRRIADIIP